MPVSLPVTSIVFGTAVLIASSEMTDAVREAGMIFKIMAYTESLRASCASWLQVDYQSVTLTSWKLSFLLLTTIITASGKIVWRKHFCKTLPSTGTKHYFGVLADTFTSHSDSLHVIGLILPCKNEIQPNEVGIVENQSGTREGLAEKCTDLFLNFLVLKNLENL